MYHYATNPANVVTDSAGNTVPGWRLTMYDSREGGSAVTDLETLDGEPLPGYVTTDADGRYPFRRVDESEPVLWADDGQSGERWSLVSVEAAAAAANALTKAEQAQAAATAAAASAQEAAQSVAEAGNVDAALAELTAYQEQTPTLEELTFTTKITSVNYQGTLYPSHTSTFTVVAMVAPFPLTIRSLALAWDYYNLAANDQAYWEVVLRRGTADGPVNVAARNTRATGAGANGGITGFEPWTFSGADTTAATFAAGDLVLIQFLPYGTPPKLVFGTAITLRYAAV